MLSFVKIHSSNWSIESLQNLNKAVLSGKSSFEIINNCSLFEDLEKGPQSSKVFNSAMLLAQKERPRLLVNEIDFSKSASILDIGGGIEFALFKILEKYPNLNGFLIKTLKVIKQINCRSQFIFLPAVTSFQVNFFIQFLFAQMR